MIKLIITYQASSSSSHCAAQSPKLTRVTGSSPCFNTCEYFLNPPSFVFSSSSFLYLFHHGQSILANNFYIFFHCFSFSSSPSTCFTKIRPRKHFFHHQPWFHLLVNSGGLSASASDLVSAFGPCPLWTRWHHTLDGVHID